MVEVVAENAQDEEHRARRRTTGRATCAGQHVDVRLTAEDGYQAQRSYSIASAPRGRAARPHRRAARRRRGVAVPDRDVLEPGDELELRGPIGGYFVWQEALGGPLLLVAGGSGVVPLRAMLRHHRATASEIPVRLLYSARTRGDLIYRDELADYDTTITLTREQPPGWNGRTGRVDPDAPRRDRVAARGASARLRLRPDRASWRRSPTRSSTLGHDPSPHQDGEVRPDMIALVQVTRSR